MDQAHEVVNLKIIMIGESGVGKSCLMLRFTDPNYDIKQTITTMGVDCRNKRMTVGPKTVNLLIWDTAGQDRFRALTSAYYRDAQGVLLVYDVSDYDSFTALQGWLQELDTYSTKDGIVKIIVGNKVDLDHRAVTEEQAMDFARRHQAFYTEVSAITRFGVESAFEKLVYEILLTPHLWESDNRNNVIHLEGQTSENPLDRCCVIRLFS